MISPIELIASVKKAGILLSNPLLVQIIYCRL